MNNVQAIVQSVPGVRMADVTECTVLMANLTEYGAFNGMRVGERWTHERDDNGVAPDSGIYADPDEEMRKLLARSLGPR